MKRRQGFAKGDHRFVRRSAASPGSSCKPLSNGLKRSQDRDLFFRHTVYTLRTHRHTCFGGRSHSLYATTSLFGLNRSAAAFPRLHMPQSRLSPVSASTLEPETTSKKTVIGCALRNVK